MGVPKKRTSHARKGKRRSHHALRPPSLSVCPKCKSYKLPHRVCPHCGTYKGVQYIPLKVV
jgi:large subunit ribosomal protein L32